MTTPKEWNDAFDTAVSAYAQVNPTAQEVLEFDIYEKSLALTKAQDELVISFYTGRIPTNEGFEATEEIRRYLSSLVRTSVIPKDNSTVNPISKYSNSFKLDDKVWFITYEAIILGENSDPCLNQKEVEVVPVTQDEYHKIKKNPFRGMTSNRALRVDNNGTTEIIYNGDVANYYIKYIEEPEPIIVDDLDSTTTIKGKYEANPCKLHSGLHSSILERAVQIAVSSRISNNNKS